MNVVRARNQCYVRNYGILGYVCWFLSIMLSPISNMNLENGTFVKNHENAAGDDVGEIRFQKFWENWPHGGLDNIRLPEMWGQGSTPRYAMNLKWRSLNLPTFLSRADGAYPRRHTCIDPGLFWYLHSSERYRASSEIKRLVYSVKQLTFTDVRGRAVISWINGLHTMKNKISTYFEGGI